MDFFILVSSHPKHLVHKLATVTGFASLPPYFSLGYHQSRWSYYSADDVININQRFDFNDVPFDVIWLDIDVTDHYT
jgi:alpha-glucosidase (family GH31 glycosyl hydrolase)